MNKIERYRQEKEMHLARIRKSQARCEELDRLIREQENLEIVSLVRAERIGLDELAVLLKGLRGHRGALDVMKEDYHDEQEG